MLVFGFQGYVDITINVVESNSNNITLHVKDITIFENTIVVANVGNNSQRIEVVGCSYDDPREFLIVKLAQNLNSGQAIRLSMGFLGNLNDKMAGFYRSSYFDKVRESVRVLLIFSRPKKVASLFAALQLVLERVS